MAIFNANTQETFDTEGIREELTDIIYNISPTETPFMMMAGRGSTGSFKHEWQMDQLSAAADNARHEGYTVAAISAVNATIRMANYTQISDKHISITGTNEVVNKAGRNSELSYQLAKRAKELKRDMEWTMVGNTTVANMASVAGVSATARRSAAVQAQFHANWYTTGSALPGCEHQPRLRRAPTAGTSSRRTCSRPRPTARSGRSSRAR